MKKDIKEIKNVYIAHRGLHNIKEGVPENSLMAFQKAIEIERAIEIDLHLLKDGKIIVFHDDNLKRMTGIDKNVRDCIYEEIKDLKLLGTSQNIPLFQEVLTLVNGKVLLDIEFKYDNKVGFLEKEACKLLENYKGKFIVKSFNPMAVKWFKENKPAYIRGQLVSDFKNEKMNFVKRFVLKNMLLNFVTKPDFIAHNIKVINKREAKRIKNKGIPLLLWTIQTHEQLELAQKIGDSYIYEKIKI